jgi:hypothetical protein
MKTAKILFILFILLAFSTIAQAAKMFGATSLTGGGTGALDKINGSSLSDGDGAIVITGNQSYTYTLDADSALAESLPSIISPDTNAGDKRWILVKETSYVINVKDAPYFATGNGSTDDRAAITAADTASSGEPLYFPAGNYRIASNLTISNVIILSAGAYLEPDASVQITCDAYADIGQYQAFTYAAGSYILLNDNDCIYGVWFGIDSANSDNITALNWATACLQPGQDFQLPEGDLIVTDQWTLDNDAVTGSKTNCTFRGYGGPYGVHDVAHRGTFLFRQGEADDTDAVLEIENTMGLRFEDMGFDANDLAEWCVRIDPNGSPVSRLEFVRCNFIDANSHNVFCTYTGAVSQIDEIAFEHCWFRNAGIDSFYANAPSMVAPVFRHCGFYGGDKDPRSHISLIGCANHTKIEDCLFFDADLNHAEGGNGAGYTIYMNGSSISLDNVDMQNSYGAIYSEAAGSYGCTIKNLYCDGEYDGTSNAGDSIVLGQAVPSTLENIFLGHGGVEIAGGQPPYILVSAIDINDGDWGTNAAARRIGPGYIDDGAQTGERYFALVNGQRIFSTDGYPGGGGPYVIGDYFFNSAPSIGEDAGWITTGAGSPGTGKGFGIIGLNDIIYYNGTQLGIGASPVVGPLLTVSNSDSIARFICTRDQTSQDLIEYYHNSATPQDNDNAFIVFTADSDTTARAISAAIGIVSEDVTHASRQGGLFFAPSNAGVRTEYMRLTAAGYLGIYTTEPNCPLDVNDTAQVENLIVDYFISHGVTADITAVNPGGQGDGVLTTEINEISTVGTADDAVTMPVAVAGRVCRIANNGANQLEIWPNTDDDVGAGANTSVTLAAGSNVTYIAYDGTNWESF